MLKHNELVEFLKSTQPIADDQTAVRAVFLYPEWKAGLEVKKGDRLQCGGLLYKALQDHATQDNWKPSQSTASIWEAINVEHTGTSDDPIPFSLNMVVFKDNYYMWEGVLYLCTRDSGIALQNPPDQLIGHYFELA